MIKFYVGKFENVREEVLNNTFNSHNPFERLHLTDFEKYLNYLRNHDDFFEFWTNNPGILWYCDWDEVVVCDSKKNEKSFKDHPKYEQWKKELVVGEFWTMFGEEW